MIQDSAFWFANIKKVVLPDTLSIIGANAFMDCHRLESVIIPAGVKTIGDLAFDDDWELRTRVSDKYREVEIDEILRRFMAL